MSENSLTAMLGVPVIVRAYGAVIAVHDGTRGEARAFVPGMLDAMAAHGIVARGAASIEGADGAVTIEIPCDPPKATSTDNDTASADPIAKPKSGRWHK